MRFFLVTNNTDKHCFFDMQIITVETPKGKKKNHF